MKYCTHCGSGLQEDMSFCPKCGEKYQNAAAAEPSASEPSKSSLKKKTWIALTTGAAIVVFAVVGAVMLFEAEREIPAGPEASGSLETAQELPEEPAAPSESGVPAASPAPAAANPLDNPEALSALSASVVMLDCYDKHNNPYCSGSGFLAFRDDVIVTNCHVIDEEVYRINVLAEDGRVIPVTHVLNYSKKKDIAILKLSGSSGLEPLPFGDIGRLAKGERVFTIGSPLGLFNSVSDGIISGLWDSEDLIQFTASISPGSSGGALFNQRGEVIGVTTSTSVEGQNLNLAVSIDVVKQMWEKVNEANSYTISEFYNIFPHAMQFNDAIRDRKALNNKHVIVSGYISTTYIDVIDDVMKVTYLLVDDPSGVIGRTILNSHDRNEENMGVSDEDYLLLQFEAERENQLRTIRVHMNAVEYSDDTTYLAPGSHASFEGTLLYYSSPESLSEKVSISGAALFD